ncbi:MAG: serine hydrolase domain-containing protein [Bacteroidales bacterium]
MKTPASFLFAFFLSVTALAAQTADSTQTAITIGDSVHNTLSTGSVHSYILELEPDQFVVGYVDQQTVDVVVSIVNPEGQITATFDGPAQGRESFQFETTTGGVYHIEVTPFEEEEGDYAILVSVAQPVATDPEGRIDQLMTLFTGNDVPGAAAMFIRDGEIQLLKFYGMSNLTYGIPMNENTLHNIGSTSKQFLTFALLLLQEEGELSLDDDVREYIPELPEFKHTVTLRHLVNHTSGYREYLNLLAMTGRNTSADLTIEKVIGIVQRQPELQNLPGAEFNYNNTGYALMTEVINRVTSTPFPEWMKQHVFEPLEMHHTVVRTSPYQIVENRAAGYSPASEGFREVTDLGGAAGAGGIHSTMGDLAKWVRNLTDPTLGTPAMIEEMSTSFELNDGSSSGYGLGLFTGEYKGVPYYHHGGADVAHRSMVMVFPGLNAAVVTQSNHSSFPAVIPNQVADLFLEEHLATDEKAEKEDTVATAEETSFEYDAEQFDPLTGRYELEVMPGFVLTFDREEERIFAQATNQPQVNLTATSDSTFSLNGVDASVTFHINEDATADSLTLHQNGNHIARKIKFTLEPDQMKDYTGRYFSEEIQTHYTVVLEEDSLYLRHYQMEDDLQMNATTEDTFSSAFPITSMHFVRGENGEITGFKASSGRTRGVLFEKWE